MTSYFFDLDGTLTDPKPGITRCIQHALKKLGRAIPHEDDLTWCIGPPLMESFETMLGDHDSAVKALNFYRERFAEIGFRENQVYPGIEDILAGLAGSDHRLFIATSKPLHYTLRIVKHFEIDGYFERVFGSELDGTRSDKTELLRYALERTAGRPAEAVMVGDRRHDMAGARNNAMTAVGVLYGYGSEEELLAAGAHGISATVAELPEVLAEMAGPTINPARPHPPSR